MVGRHRATAMRGLAAAGLLVLPAAAVAEPPPASAFGRIPAVVDAEISPNGKHVAILGGGTDRRFISIATIDDPWLPQLDLGDVETVNLRWAGDDYVLATVAYWDKTAPRQAYRVERHIAVTPQAKAVSRFLDTGVLPVYLVGSQPILGVTRDGHAKAVVQDLAEVGDRDIVPAIWHVDPATGKGKLVEKGDADTRYFDVDRSGHPRVRVDAGRVRVLGRAKGKTAWTPILTDAPAERKTKFLGYTEPDDGVYLVADDKIVLKSLVDGSVRPFADGGRSLALIWDPHRNTAVGVSTGLERPSVKWMDAEIGATHAVLARTFRGRHVAFAGWSEDRTRFVARVGSPTSPPVWYLFDKTRKEVSLLAEEYPELKGVKFGVTQWVTYKARDGQEIHAYVTLPPGAAAGQKLPLVVMPHGGPATRDIFDFDFLAQFVASRGYVVLQPQFRGSVGFGDDFEQAGRGEWAGKMQTDLLDGVTALAERGDVDPAKVCIVGASFGGYAALAAATFHPKDYRCAVSIAGIGDLGLLLVEEGRLYGRESESAAGLRDMLGGASRQTLDATSPLRHVRQIEAPILLIHGEKDTVVQAAQSQLMAERLERLKKPHELLILPDENHYLMRAATRTKALETIERFLARYLPVD